MTSTDYYNLKKVSNSTIDKALGFLEAYLSQGFGLEELDFHAKRLQRELKEYRHA